MTKKISMGLVVAILVLLLVVAVGYIAYGVYAQKQIQKEVAIYQQGIQAGSSQAITFMFKQADACSKPVPIRYNNQTLNLVAVKCLKKS